MSGSGNGSASSASSYTISHLSRHRQCPSHRREFTPPAGTRGGGVAEAVATGAAGHFVPFAACIISSSNRPALLFPLPSSNWRIKTAPDEDNEVEATVTARLNSMPTSPLSVVLQHLLAD